MGSLFLILSLMLVISLSMAVCVTANAKVKWYNMLIGSLIIYFCFLFSYVLEAGVFPVVMVCIFSFLFNSFFYTNYEFSTKNILIFSLYVAYILFIEGIKYEAYMLFYKYNVYILNIFIVISSIFLLLFISLILRFCIKRALLSSYIFRCRLQIAGCKLNLELFLDSGNFLKYGKDDLPVVVISKNRLRRVQIKETKKMDMQGILNRSGSLAIIIPEEFEISIKGRWEKKSVAIGIVEKEFVFYDGLIGLGCINKNLR